MLKAIAILIAIFILACVAPTPDKHNISNITLTNSNAINYCRYDSFCPYHTRPVRIEVDGQFTPTQVDWIRDSLRYLEKLGVIATVERTNTDVLIRRWRSQNCLHGRMGQYWWGRSFVEIDPDCSTGRQQFEALIEHELGHWLGMHHICRVDGRTSDTCSNVGRGSAIMNPYLDVDHNLTPTRLDIEEYERVYFERCLIPTLFDRNSNSIVH
jgi:hypothetical protein